MIYWDLDNNKVLKECYFDLMYLVKVRKMTFKTFQLIVDGKSLCKADMQKICDQGNRIYSYKFELYEVEMCILEERFLWMSCRFDNAELYTDHVWNSESKQKENNPRKKSQIECRKQLFVCYDIEKCLLYISDMQKRAFLSNYLEEILGKDVKIKNILKSIEDFQNIVKTLKRVTFIQQRNIMNITPDSIFDQVANIYGFDAPERMYIKVDYGNTPISKMKSFIQKLKIKRNVGEFENIIIVGEDDYGIEHSFNFSSIIKSILININKNENGHYSEKEVIKLLLLEIR